jgi:modulator of FtsH protease
MDSYAVAEWKDFYVAVSGAAAAFAGLLFVGLSINLTAIIKAPGISDRAGETLIFLGAVLVAALLGLVPQTSTAFGLELLCIFCFVWCVATYLDVRALRRRLYDTLYHGYQRFAFTQVATLPLMIAALSFLLRGGREPYWLVPGLIFPLLVSMSNAWVLLVEIMR